MIKISQKCKANIEGTCCFECEPCIYGNIKIIGNDGKEITFKELWNKSNPK